MRILIERVTNKISGVEVYNLNFLIGLKKYKDLEIIFLSNNKELLKKVSELQYKTVNINLLIKEIGTKKDLLKALFLSPWFLINYLKVINNLEKEGKFDLIILQSMTEKIFLTAILKFRSKVLWIEHGPLFISNRAEIIKKLYVLISRFTDKIITVSKNTEEDLRKSNVDKGKIKTFYIGVDTEEFSPLNSEVIKKEKEKIDIKKNNIIIGFLGSICKEKGIEEFFEISKILCSKNNNFKFLIIGHGPLLFWLKQNVKKAGIFNDYIFTGFTKDVKNYLGLIDIFLFPTKHNEGLSIALLQALSMGVPVVATDIGGNKEIIKNGFNGHLYSKNENMDRIIKLIIKTYENKLSISNNAKISAVQNFNIMENIEQFYKMFKGEF